MIGVGTFFSRASRNAERAVGWPSANFGCDAWIAAIVSPRPSRSPKSRLRLCFEKHVSIKSPRPLKPANVSGFAPHATPSRRISDSARETKPGLGVVAVAEAVAHARADGDDVFQRAAVFHAENIRAAIDAKFRAVKKSLHRFRRAVAFARADNCGWNAKRNFAREARSGQRGDRFAGACSRKMRLMVSPVSNSMPLVTLTNIPGCPFNFSATSRNNCDGIAITKHSGRRPPWENPVPPSNLSAVLRRANNARCKPPLIDVNR